MAYLDVSNNVEMGNPAQVECLNQNVYDNRNCVCSRQEFQEHFRWCEQAQVLMDYKKGREKARRSDWVREGGYFDSRYLH